MTIKRFLLVCGLASCLVGAAAAQSFPSRVTGGGVVAQATTADDAMLIGPLKIGASEADVRAALGDPDKEEGPEPDSVTGAPTLYWDYPGKGVNVVLEAKKDGDPYHLVTVILNEPSSWKAASGLTIGGDETAARAALKSWLSGKDVVEMDLGDNAENTAAIHFKGLDVVLAVAFEGGKISSIFLGPP